MDGNHILVLKGQLERAMARMLPNFGGTEMLSRLSGGASAEIWSFDALLSGVRRPFILRRSPPGGGGGADNSPGTEAFVMETVRQSGVKAPAVICVLEAADGLGEGYVMERISGESLARKILRDSEFDNIRPRLAFDCGLLAAKIHRVDMSSFGMLQVIDGPTQLQHFRELYFAFDSPRPVFDVALKWLSSRLQPPHRLVLTHGDFRNGNFLISPRGVEAILDWENAHIGDPLEDLSWICMKSWRFGHHDNVVGGFGGLDELLAGYLAGGGNNFAPADLVPWIIFGSLKWGIMCMGMHKRSLEDKSVERAVIGRRSSECELDLLNSIISGIL